MDVLELAVKPLYAFQNLFDENISWLRDTGIISKMIDDERKTEDISSSSKVSENQPLSIIR